MCFFPLHTSLCFLYKTVVLYWLILFDTRFEKRFIRRHPKGVKYVNVSEMLLLLQHSKDITWPNSAEKKQFIYKKVHLNENFNLQTLRILDLSWPLFADITLVILSFSFSLYMVADDKLKTCQMGLRLGWKLIITWFDLCRLLVNSRNDQYCKHLQNHTSLVSVGDCILVWLVIPFHKT